MRRFFVLASFLFSILADAQTILYKVKITQSPDTSVIFRLTENQQGVVLLTKNNQERVIYRGRISAVPIPEVEPRGYATLKGPINAKDIKTFVQLNRHKQSPFGIFFVGERLEFVDYTGKVYHLPYLPDQIGEHISLFSRGYETEVLIHEIVIEEPFQQEPPARGILSFLETFPVQDSAFARLYPVGITRMSLSSTLPQTIESPAYENQQSASPAIYYLNENGRSTAFELEAARQNDGGFEIDFNHYFPSKAFVEKTAPKRTLSGCKVKLAQILPFKQRQKAP